MFAHSSWKLSLSRLTALCCFVLPSVAYVCSVQGYGSMCETTCDEHEEEVEGLSHMGGGVRWGWNAGMARALWPNNSFQAARGRRAGAATGDGRATGLMPITAAASGSRDDGGSDGRASALGTARAVESGGMQEMAVASSSVRQDEGWVGSGAASISHGDDEGEIIRIAE